MTKFWVIDDQAKTTLCWKWEIFWYLIQPSYHWYDIILRTFGVNFIVYRWLKKLLIEIQLWNVIVGKFIILAAILKYVIMLEALLGLKHNWLNVKKSIFQLICCQLTCLRHEITFFYCLSPLLCGRDRGQPEDTPASRFWSLRNC